MQTIHSETMPTCPIYNHTPRHEYSMANQFSLKRCINSHKATTLNIKKRKAKKFSLHLTQKI